MQIERMIRTVETHTGGEPFRIIVSGLPRFSGATIVQRRDWVKNNIDELRRALIFEPRGHADMYAGYLTEAVSPNADFGVIFVHNEGYSDHCGHGDIGRQKNRPSGEERRMQSDTLDRRCHQFVSGDLTPVGEALSAVVPEN